MVEGDPGWSSKLSEIFCGRAIPVIITTKVRFCEKKREKIPRCHHIYIIFQEFNMQLRYIIFMLLWVTSRNIKKNKGSIRVGQ